MVGRDEADHARRRGRIDDVFGEVLPRTSADERDPGSDRARESPDDWYRDNRPPHHDR